MTGAVPPDCMTDQPQPAAVRSMVIDVPSVSPSWSSGRSAIVKLIPLRSASALAVLHSARACATTGARASAVSAAGTADPAGAAAGAGSAPSLSTIVTVPVPVTLQAPPAFQR